MASTPAVRARLSSWRLLAPLALAASVVTCDAPTGVRRPGVLAVEPVLAVGSLVNFSGLSVDKVRLTAIRPPADTIARRDYAFAAESTQISASLSVQVLFSEEILVTMELLAGNQVMFTGQRLVTVTAGQTTPPPPTPIPLTFTGPGAGIAELIISPRDTGVTFGRRVPFSAVATDSSDQPVALFYTSWAARSTVHTIDANGVFSAGTSRGSVWIVAQTPSGARDSTRVTVNPAATQLQVVSGTGQSGPTASVLAQPVVVRVLAADNLPVAGALVQFQVSGGGTAAPAQTSTDTLGRASTVVTLGTQAGAQAVTASVSGAPPVQIAFTATTLAGVPSQVTKSAGDGQQATVGAPVAVAPQVLVLDAQNNPVPNVAVTFAVATGGGSITGATPTTDAQGLASVGSWTLGPAAGPNTLTATVAGLPPVTFTATGTTPQPGIQLSVAGSGVLGVGGTGTLDVRLTTPAPAGGVTVSVTSDSLQVLTVAPPGTALIAAGDSTGTVQLTGIAFGVSIVHATASGYQAAQLPVVVTPSIIVLQTPLTVAAGSTTAMTVTLTTPAPAGGLTVTFASTDTTIARTTQPTLVIGAGLSSGAEAVQGVAAGTAGITATAPGYVMGAAVVTVTAGGVPDTLVAQAGDGQTAYVGDSVAVRPQVVVLDALGAPVPGVLVQFAIQGGGGTLTAPSAVTDSQGLAAAGVWTLGAAPGANTVFAVLPLFPLVTPVTFTATGVLPPPDIVLSVFGSNVVGRARAGQLDVRLLQAAPAGGLVVTVISDSTQLLTVGSFGSPSATMNFAAGDTLLSITVFGDSTRTGIARVRASAPGYTPDTLDIPVSQNLISLPATLTVPLSQTVSLPVQISTPAPAGGLPVTVTSSDPSRVVVTTPLITVPAGQTLANATVQGAGLGSATVTATNPNFAPFSSAVTVSATLNITQTSITANASFGTPITIQLESGGSPVSAPAGGVPLTFSVASSTCIAAPTGMIGAGFVNTSVVVTYAGSASLPCASQLYVNGPAGYVGDTVLVSVQPQPTATVYATYLGSGLQRGVFGNLGASNHGGTTVHVVSADTAVFLVSPNDTTPGSASADIPMLPGATQFLYYIQARDSVTADSALVTATAPGFQSGSGLIKVYPAVFDIIFLTTSGNSRQADDPFQVRLGSSSTPTGGISTEDERRAGAAPLAFSVVNDSAGVGTLVTSGLTGDSVTVTIGARQSRSPTTVATGGVAFDFLAGGVTTVRASAPGLRGVAGSTHTVTISAPTVSVGATYLGAGLQRAVNVNLSAAAIAGDTLRLIPSKTGVVWLSATDTAQGGDTLVVALTPGTSNVTYYIQGVDSVTADTVTLTPVIAGFTSTAAATRVYTPVFDIIFLTTAGTSRQADDPFQIRIGSASTPTGGISSEDALRPGAAARTVTVVNDSAGVGTLVTSGVTADSVTTTIAARQSRTPTTVAAGGVAFDFLAGGTTTVRASIPGFRTIPTSSQAVTVSAPVVSTGSTYIGAGLQRASGVSLTAAAVAGDTLRLVPSKAGVVWLSPVATAQGVDSLIVALAPGTTFYSFYVQGVDSITADSVTVSATIPGFTSGTPALVRVYTPVYDIIFLNNSANTLTASDPFQVRIGTPSTPTGGISSEDEIRAGGAARTVTVTSSASTVAQLVTTTRTGDTATVAIAAQASRSPSTVATGGVELDYLTTGTTVVRASIPGWRAVTTAIGDTVTVTAPTISVSGPTVGAGLQVSSGASLAASQHGGVDVVVKSLNPAVALVSPNATTPGTDSIIIHLNNGTSSLGYYVQGVEGQAGAVTVRVAAPGFVDGSATITIVPPALDVIFLATSGSAASSADDPFQVRLGYANSPFTSMAAEQALRAGAPGPLTVTIQSTNPAAGLLKTLTGSAGGDSIITVQIAVGFARSAATVATGGVAFDFVAPGLTFVVPTIAGYLTVPPAGFQVTVNP